MIANCLRFYSLCFLAGACVCTPCLAIDPATEAKAAAIAAAAAERAPKVTNPSFEATAAQMDAAMHVVSAASQKDPLQFPKGNGLRVLMCGHSYVAPAVRSLPPLAAAAGYEGHHQRSHNSGGSTGSANSIWLTEFGKFRDKPAQPILLPALATGQWDVMTWGAYYHDTPECYTMWIDACLAKNSQMQFLIQDGWPSYPREVDAANHDLILAVLQKEMALGQNELFKKLYEGLNTRNPGKVHIIPAAAAVVEMIGHYYAGELPGFDCISEHLGGRKGVYRDGGHLSSSGGMDQIVGYLYFGMLYRQSPELVAAYRPPNVDPTVDRFMRQAAWHAITQSPFSGITDKAGKGVAD